MFFVSGSVLLLLLLLLVDGDEPCGSRLVRS